MSAAAWTLYSAAALALAVTGGIIIGIAIFPLWERFVRWLEDAIEPWEPS